MKTRIIMFALFLMGASTTAFSQTYVDISVANPAIEHDVTFNFGVATHYINTATFSGPVQVSSSTWTLNNVDGMELPLPGLGNGGVWSCPVNQTVPLSAPLLTQSVSVSTSTSGGATYYYLTIN